MDGVKSAMETAPGIIAASALKIGTQLVGFYTPAIPALEVKAAAEKVLPYYAIPTRFYALEHFPLTSNGYVALCICGIADLRESSPQQNGQASPARDRGDELSTRSIAEPR